MAIPSVMVFLPIVLPPKLNRWANRGTDDVPNSAVLQNAVSPNPLQRVAKYGLLARGGRVSGVDVQCGTSAEQPDRLVAASELGK